MRPDKRSEVLLRDNGLQKSANAVKSSNPSDDNMIASNEGRESASTADQVSALPDDVKVANVPSTHRPEDANSLTKGSSEITSNSPNAPTSAFNHSRPVTDNNITTNSNSNSLSSANADENSTSFSNATSNQFSELVTQPNSTRNLNPEKYANFFFNAPPQDIQPRQNNATFPASHIATNQHLMASAPPSASTPQVPLL